MRIRSLSALLDLLRALGVRAKDVILIAGISVAAAGAEVLGLAFLNPILLHIQGGMERAIADAPTPLRETMRTLFAFGLPQNLASLIAVTCVFLILRYALTYVSAIVLLRRSEKLVAQLRDRAAEAFVRADSIFRSRKNRADIVTNVINEPGRIGTILKICGDSVAAAAMAAGYVLVLLYISPALTAMMAPIAALVWIIYRFETRTARTLGAAYSSGVNAIHHALGESLGAFREIKLRNAASVAFAAIASGTAATRISAEGLGKLQARTQAVMGPLNAAVAGTLIYTGHTAVGLGIADLAVYGIVLMRLLPLLAQVNLSRLQLAGILPAAEVYGAFVADARARAEALGGAIEKFELKDKIELRDVRLDYETDDGRRIAALRGASLEVAAKQVTAFVGPSGGGKTSIVNVLTRIFEPTGGSVLVDGRPLSDWNVAALRRRVAVVSQDHLFFDATIRQNLQFGLERELDDGEIEDVLARANCLEFVRALPLGVDTRMGDQASRLSGGQKQRLALARAMAASPEVLILDEPTSALDGISEAAIRRTIADLRGSTTVLVIAHRASTVIDADAVIVLEGGRVVATGVHATLKRTNALYAKLFPDLEPQSTGKVPE